MIEIELYVLAVGAVVLLLFGFALGTSVGDSLATRYWHKELKRVHTMHKSALAATEAEAFNRGVAALAQVAANNKKAGVDNG